MRVIILALVVMNIFAVCGSAAEFSGYEHYVFDHADFATECIEYSPVGTLYDYLAGLPLNNPDNALGRPTVDTDGDGMYIDEYAIAPVNPVNSAFRYDELLFIGEGGHVSFKFNHPVRDDENNPYGVDLIVFGNAAQTIGGGTGWTNGDPELFNVGFGGFSEPGIISVSQDGIIWYSFTNDQDFMSGDSNFIKLPSDANDGPFCDSFASTLGRVYDPCNPDQSIGTWNKYWAEPTNPTLPVDPDKSFADYGGVSLADICLVYGNSAGGTGYDIGRLDLPVDPLTGKKWFTYVRVDDKPFGGNAEIDAFSDVSSCGDWKHPYPQGDINHDCRVNMIDLAVLAKHWQADVTLPDGPGNIADVLDDDFINIDDLNTIAGNWLGCSWNCD